MNELRINQPVHSTGKKGKSAPSGDAPDVGHLKKRGDVRNTSMSYNKTEILFTLWMVQIGNGG